MEAILMKRLLMALLIAVSPVGVANAGTFSDDFNDGQLDGWQPRILIPGGPRPGVRIPVKIQNGYVVMDAREKPNDNLILPGFKIVILDLRAGNPQNWNAYTFTCRVRIAEVWEEPPAAFGHAAFGITVRQGRGRFNVVAYQTMLIDPLDQDGQIFTFPSDAKGIEDDVIHRGNFKAPIKLKRWYPIKIVANGDNFAFYFNNKLLIEYEDRKAIPGTVSFRTDFGMVAHIDDVVITGPKVPDLANSVSPDGHLTTIWGEIKTD
jgi:hypothetical protein